MRKLLIAGVSALALGLSSAAFANSVSLGAGNSGGTTEGASGSTGGMPATVAGRTSPELGGTGSDTTSQREACPPGDAVTSERGLSNCIKPEDRQAR
jgi:hypothetical protein